MITWTKVQLSADAKRKDLQPLYAEIEGLLQRSSNVVAMPNSINATINSASCEDFSDGSLPGKIRPVINPEKPRRRPWSKETRDRLEADFPLDHSDYDSLQDALRTRDESFSRMLLRLIDESGMTDPQCYKAAHITAQHFSKIRTNPEHKPDKITVLKFAIALKLSEEDAETLLRSAGFDFSPHNNSDIIMRFFFRKRIYDMYTIDCVLYHFDEPLLCGEK